MLYFNKLGKYLEREHICAFLEVANITFSSHLLPYLCEQRDRQTKSHAAFQRMLKSAKNKIIILLMETALSQI